MDLIKREDAIKVIEETPFIRRPILPHYLKAKINKIPSAEKQGTYRYSDDCDEWYGLFAICNECGAEWMGDENFCPNCGARMEGADNE